MSPRGNGPACLEQQKKQSNPRRHTKGLEKTREGSAKGRKGSEGLQFLLHSFHQGFQGGWSEVEGGSRSAEEFR